jgi:hypothetical protein
MSELSAHFRLTSERYVIAVHDLPNLIRLG